MANAFPHEISQQREADAEAYRLAAIVESSEDAIIAWTLEGTLTSWNRGAERLLGYSAEEILDTPVQPTWPRDSEVLFEEVRARLSAGERVPTFDSGRVRKDGTTVEVSVTLSPITDDERRVIGVSSILRDITERKRAQRALHEMRSRSVNAFRSAPIGMALVDPEGRWLAANPFLCRLLGRDEPELRSTDFQSITHPEDLDADLEQLGRALAGEIEGFEMEKRYLRPDGVVVWTLLSASVVRAEDGEPLYFVSLVQDITERKESERALTRYTEHLKELALQDPVTGLRNYRDFHTMLASELERSRRDDDAWSIVLFDVDGFREINERGPWEGDRVLREVGVAIAVACRSSDLAAHIGSDEFSLILPSTTNEDAQRTAERIAADVAERTGGASLSFGTASWPQDGDSKELVLLRADMQLQAAKPPPEAILASFVRTSAPAPDGPIPGIQQILSLAREQLDMEVAYVAELTDTRQTLRAIAGDASSFGAELGSAVPVEATYCQRMVAGDIPNAVPDTADEPELAVLAVTAAAGIGSYLGVPLVLSDGRVYGVVCAVSHGPKPELADRHVELMRFIARLLAGQIERDEQEARTRRSEAELAGIDALLSALLARDHYTGKHSKTVVELATRVARRQGLAEEHVREIAQVALLHDIGKVGIPDSVLQKRGSLSVQEWDLMRQHPIIGARILSGTETLAHLAAAVKAEHERFDGSGYPAGLRAEAIPLASRITFACDAYHAMTSERPYRPALDPETASAELRAGAGTQFDPQVVTALLGLLEGDHGRASTSSSNAASRSEASASASGSVTASA